eukprot:1341-Pyramimonas_sp.AAC.1
MGPSVSIVALSAIRYPTLALVGLGTWLQGTFAAPGYVSNTEETAQALQDHWGSVFGATEDDESLWPELLDSVPKLPDVTEG